MYSIDCLNRQAFKLLSYRFHSDPPIYSTYLTIFSSFSKSHDIYDQHSLLYIAKCLEDQFFYSVLEVLIMAYRGLVSTSLLSTIL